MANETKNERFRRLASSRGERLIRELQLLGNLSNRKNYDYGPAEVEELFDPIESELRRVKTMFESTRNGQGRIMFDDK